MRRSIAWYSALLGLAPGEGSHEGRIYDLATCGETGIILDSHKPVTNSSQPLFFFPTDDIVATRAFLRELGVELVSDIEDAGSISFITFKDPDENLLMVCQPK